MSATIHDLRSRQGRNHVTIPLRLVVVDDNTDNAHSLSLLLEALGHESKIAHNGVQALGIAHEFQPDAMIIDIGMPGIDGHDLARRIRAEDWGRDLLLVAASGWGQDEDKQKSLEAGFNMHLVKPVELRTLEGLLATIK
jgi:CheY-like chemotaxis protein